MSRRGGRPGGGEAVAMLAAVAGIVTAQRLGYWPEALQGAAGMIVQAIVVSAPALPRGLRWAMTRLRRSGGAASIETSRAAMAGGAAGARDAFTVPRIEPGTRGDGDVGAPADPAGVGGGGELAESGDFLADFLPDPTMWPSWPPVADNDDEAKPTAV